MPERFHDNPAAANRPVQQRRHEAAVPEAGYDSYRTRGGRDLPEPSVCEDCGAVFHGGRWTWGAAPPDAASTQCPACERIHDRYPAGFLTVSGPFFVVHREEIEHLIANVAATEGREHPLNRIIDTQALPDGVELTTTDVHLARRLGEAIHHACAGELSVQYADEDQVVRVAWRR